MLMSDHTGSTTLPFLSVKRDSVLPTVLCRMVKCPSIVCNHRSLLDEYLDFLQAKAAAWRKYGMYLSSGAEKRSAPTALRLK